MLIWAGAVLSGFLGYRLHEWWTAAAVACAVVAVQFAMFQLVLESRGTTPELYAFSLALNLVVYYATFSIGRAIGQRLGQRRKGVR
jgi:hypothetical protein